MAEPVRLSVDLGTTHTVAVVRRGDQQPRALLFDGSPLLPSGVHVDESGTVHTGRDAVRLGASTPERFEPHPKRRIDEGSVLLGTDEVPVADLLAATLRRVVSEVRHAGVDPTDATVLTCPADWGQPRRTVLLAAAHQAGLGRVRLLDEPIAAAAYCVQVLGQQVPPGGCLGIFDFGGGTLDITVVRHEPAGPRVLATGGLDDLGGLDVDDALVAHLGQLVGLQDAEAWRRLREPRTPAERRDRQAFWTEIRAAKEMLSRSSMAPVSVPGREEPMHLTREELDRIAAPLVARAVDETRRVLQRAGIEPSTLAGLLLVGGSSRIPMVATRLHTRLGVAPSVPEQPELPVAYGALVGAAMSVAGPGSATPPGFAAMSVAGPGSATPPGFGAVPPSPGAGGSAFGPGSAGFDPTSPPSGPNSPVSAPGTPGSGAPVSGAGAPAFDPTSPAAGPSAPVSGPGGAFPPAGGYPGAPYPPVGSPSGRYPDGPSYPAGPSPFGKTLPVRRPRPARRAVAALVTVVLLGGCGLAAVKGTRWLTGLFGNGGPTGDSGLKIPGLTDTDGGERAGSLKLVAERPAQGAGATGVTVAGDRFVVATVGVESTTVAVIPGTGGDPAWTATVKMEPTEVQVTPVGDLLLVDGKGSVLHDGKAVRAVLDAKRGTVLWTKTWEDRTDVAYYGTEAVVEVLDGIYDNAVERVDLRTGKKKVSRDGNDDLLLSPAHRIEPMRTFPEAGKPDGPGVLPPTAGALRDAFTATGVVVELDTERQKGYELDATTLKTRGSGALPLDEELWTAYDGLAIGKQHESASRGRAVLAAYQVPGFKLAWTVPLPAGNDIDRVKPCGPHLVCAAINESGSKPGRTIAVDTRTHREAWKVEVDWSDDESWYVGPDALVLGDSPFQVIGQPRVLGFGGKKLHEYDQFTNAVAVSGGRMALRTYEGMKQQWQIRVVDMRTGKETPPLSVGDKMPTQVSLSGDYLTVTSEDRRIFLAKAAELS